MATLAEIYDGRVASGTLTEDPVQRAVLPQLEQVREAVLTPVKRGGFFGRKRVDIVRGLYIWGGVGRGKSMIMDMFFDETDLKETQKRRVHFHAFMQEVHRGMAAARKRGVDDALAPVAERLSDGLRLLCFDEMQITDITDAMLVGRLFEMLMEAGVAIVTTSNRPPDDLYENGLNRQLFLPFIAYLKDHMEVWELDAHRDYRQDKLAGSQTYFTPLNGETGREINRIWGELATGPTDPLTLTVQGRQVELAQYSAGVARTSFWNLCGQALGAADYLAVAEAVRVLILENVPSLSSENYNEARRFVTLIDALYEARVRLIVSAAEVPQRLYLEGSGLFEFERTASRLREMQSADWAD